MGKLAFISVQDDSGTIQLYIDKKALDQAEEGAFKCVQFGLRIFSVVVL